MEGLLLDYLRDHTDRSVRHAARTCFQAFNDFWIKEEEHAMILDEQRRRKERELEEARAADAQLQVRRPPPRWPRSWASFSLF